jgi:hypothetical protein
VRASQQKTNSFKNNPFTLKGSRIKRCTFKEKKNEKKLTTMEKERADALEMAAKAHEKRKEEANHEVATFINEPGFQQSPVGLWGSLVSSFLVWDQKTPVQKGLAHANR